LGDGINLKKHLIIAASLAVVLSIGLGYLFYHLDFIPRASSAERTTIDQLLRTLFTIAAVFFSIIVVFFFYSLIFFRRKKGDDSEGAPIRGHSGLEFTWTIIPLAIVLVLGAYGGVVLNRMTQPGTPQTEMEVDVTAFRYGWKFDYPADKIQSYVLYLPVNQKIVFKIQSLDVVHSFWVQEFGPKQDAVPGLTTELRVTPDKVGQYFVECSQLCGAGHTNMIAPVSVVSPADFQSWAQAQPKTP
jgi:cytochrome c oxidase subunit II